jgi:hypothetical protein
MAARFAFFIAFALCAPLAVPGTGLMRWFGGLAMLALAGLLVLWTRRSQQGLQSELERRRLTTAVLAPLGTLVSLWIDLAGVPLIPSQIVAVLRLALGMFTLMVMPVSLLAIVRLPPGARTARFALVIGAAVVLLVRWLIG